MYKTNKEKFNKIFGEEDNIALARVISTLTPPLIFIILTFAIAVLVLSLLPGVDNAGNIYYLSFFESFYFTLITATTIGFGELPYDFTIAQRWWTIHVIIFTVMSWFFVLTRIVSIFRDEIIIKSLERQKLIRKITKNKKEIIIIHGINSLTKMILSKINSNSLILIIEIDKNKINELQAIEEERNIDFLIINLSSTSVKFKEILKIIKKQTKYVISTLNNDEVNSYILTITKKLSPKTKVIMASKNKNSYETYLILKVDKLFKAEENLVYYLEEKYKEEKLKILYNYIYKIVSFNSLREEYKILKSKENNKEGTFENKVVVFSDFKMSLNLINSNIKNIYFEIVYLEEEDYKKMNTYLLNDIKIKNENFIINLINKKEIYKEKENKKELIKKLNKYESIFFLFNKDRENIVNISIVKNLGIDLKNKFTLSKLNDVFKYDMYKELHITEIISFSEIEAVEIVDFIDNDKKRGMLEQIKKEGEVTINYILNLLFKNAELNIYNYHFNNEYCILKNENKSIKEILKNEKSIYPIYIKRKIKNKIQIINVIEKEEELKYEDELIFITEKNNYEIFLYELDVLRHK